MNAQPILRSKRITSIDALRAFVLLGVLLTHLWAGFNVEDAYQVNSVTDMAIDGFIPRFLTFRCAMIFNVLFGVSFYLMLRNPANSGGKFVWRCFLLFILGILDKFLYWPDALMWYGLCGMFLVLFRRLSVSKLILSIILFYLLIILLCQHAIGSYFLSPYISDFNRYRPNITFHDAWMWWPSSVLTYLRHMLDNGVFYTFANFLIGYTIGKAGLVDKMDRAVNLRIVLISLMVYVLALFILYSPSVSFIWRLPVTLSGAAFYSVLFVYLYNRRPFHRFLSWFEPYGRLGLTNYVMQGVVGVILLCHCGVGGMHLHLATLVAFALLFFLLQAFFSWCWLKKFTYGPFEYLWRCATERKWIPFIKSY